MTVIILFGFLAVLFAFLSQKNKVSIAETGDNVIAYRYEKFSNVFFVISFLLLALPCFFCGTGKDMAAYVQLYDSFSLDNFRESSFEIGYVLSSLFLRIFFDNAYIALGIIKVLSVFLVYMSIYILKDKLNVGFSVLSYVILLYIFNFHLLRMSMAIGIIFLSLTYELTGKSKKAVAGMIVAFFFHYTSIIVLLAYVIYKIMGKKITYVKIAVFSIFLVLTYLFIVPILNYLVPAIKLFNKYGMYLDTSNSDTGIVQLILFIPIAYILIMLYKKGVQDKFYIMSAVLGIMLFFSGSLGYLLPVVSRTAYYFFYSVIVLFAATPLVNDRCVFTAGKFKINSTTLMSVIYLMMQAVIVYILNNSFVSNGLTEYTLWWNL